MNNKFQVNPLIIYQVSRQSPMAISKVQMVKHSWFLFRHLKLHLFRQQWQFNSQMVFRSLNNKHHNMHICHLQASLLLFHQMDKCLCSSSHHKLNRLTWLPVKCLSRSHKEWMDKLSIMFKLSLHNSMKMDNRFTLYLRIIHLAWTKQPHYKLFKRHLFTNSQEFNTSSNVQPM